MKAAYAVKKCTKTRPDEQTNNELEISISHDRLHLREGGGCWRAVGFRREGLTG